MWLMKADTGGLLVLLDYMLVSIIIAYDLTALMVMLCFSIL